MLNPQKIKFKEHRFISKTSRKKGYSNEARHPRHIDTRILIFMSLLAELKEGKRGETEEKIWTCTFTCERLHLRHACACICTRACTRGQSLVAAADMEFYERHERGGTHDRGTSFERYMCDMRVRLLFTFNAHHLTFARTLCPFTSSLTFLSLRLFTKEETCIYYDSVHMSIKISSFVSFVQIEVFFQFFAILDE